MSAVKGKKKRKGSEPENVHDLYGQAVSAVHEGNYKGARALFERLAKSFPDEIEILSRAELYLRFCDRQERLQESEVPESTDELFDLGVYLHNKEERAEALGFFEKALKKAGKGNVDHIHYATAACHVSGGNLDDALKHLKKAIELRETNRFFARNDPDFEPLSRNSEFQKLIGGASNAS